MESAEISKKDLSDDISLTNHKTLRGILHIYDVNIFEINGHPVQGKFIKTYDEGNIYSFDIKDNKATLVLSWINLPPKKYIETDFIEIIFIEKNFIWENSPNLINPYWK